MLLIPTVHPAALLRRTGGDQDLARFMQTVIADVKKAVRLSKEAPQWDETCLWGRDGGGRLKAVFPTLQELHDFCIAARGYDLAVDVETTGISPLDCRLICIGLASANGTVICVPFLRQGGGPYWSSDDEGRRAWDLVCFLLADSLTAKVLHNGAFDKLVLENFGAKLRYVADTMQAQHVADSELPLGLGFVATRHLDVSYWKDDAKGAARWLDLPDEQLRIYNLRDCLTTLRLKPILEAEVKRLGLWSLYQQEIALCQMMTRATVRGLLLDQERRDSTTLGQDGKPIGLGPRLVLQRDDALVRLRSVAGSVSFDPQKPEHLRFLLFTQLKMPVVLETKSGLPSTDKNAMVLLALAADSPHQKAVIAALADWKMAQKKLSTWTGEYKSGVHRGGLPILGDGRLHPQWKMTPNTGRLASSPNAQNWDVAIKKLFKSGHGRKYVGVDLSQAELRYIGYTAQDRMLLSMYQQGVDVHTTNMALYFKVRYPDDHEQANPATVAFIDQQVQQLFGTSYASLPVLPKHREKPTRTLAKVGEFSTNYRAMAETVHAQLRAKRDPETNKVMFPDVTLAQIEALMMRKQKARPDLVKWWHDNQRDTEARGFLKCPISGRVRWFRGGYKVTEVANWGIQTGIASWMNKCMLEIQDIYDRETGGDCLIVQQVHDALNADCSDDYAARAGEVMEQVLGRRFVMPGHPDAHLPPDKAKSGTHLDEV